MSVATPAPFGMPQSRTPVVFDPHTSGLRIGPHERHVDDPAEPTHVYSAYLSLLYAVRGAKPGERLALRAADLEALLLLVGDDPETIEQRLVGLMGCSPQEASVLGGLLLRHRRLTATLGIAAGLALGVGGVVAAVDEPARTSPPAAVRMAAPAAESLPIADPAPTTTTPTSAAAPTFVGPPTGSVSVAAPGAADAPEQAAPIRLVRTAPTATRTARTAAPAAVPVAAPAAVPVAVPLPAAEPAPAQYVLPVYEEPVLDAPPPVEDLPDADIGSPAILDLGQPLEQIGGVTDSGEPPGPAADAPLPLQAPVEVFIEDGTPPPAESPPVPTS